MRELKFKILDKKNSKFINTFTCEGDPYATCAFSSVEEARKKDAIDWDYYFADEPYIDETWNLE